MATGAITSLGIGSGLDLQNILDQLREADGAQIRAKENKKTEYQDKINAYNGVNARLFAMKSNALNLSLASNFIKRSMTVTNENVLDAVVVDGIDKSAYTIDLDQKAQRNSWKADGVSSTDDSMFAQPTTGITEPNDIVTTVSETMSMYYGESGSEKPIDIDLTSGLSLSDIVDTINSSANNKDGDGTQLVKASLGMNSDEEYYIRLSAASGGNSADSEITVDPGFAYVQPDTTISIEQNDIAMHLSVKPGTTYQGMVDLINNAADNPGVTAAMINNGDATNPYQFTLTADNTGENGRISVSEDLTLTEVTGAAGASLDAMFSVNGIAYRRQSNSSISDVISGVTLNLKNTGETTININAEMDSVKDEIVSLVDGFNELTSYIKGSEDAEETDENAQFLAGSNDLNRLVSSLKSLISTRVNLSSAYTSLSDLGVEIQKDGTITLDEKILDQAMAADPDAVTSLFIGDSDNDITGLGDIINDSLTGMVGSQSAVSTEIDVLETMTDRLDKEIENATERLDKRYETMTAEFARLDSYIRQLNSEANAMQSMFDSVDKKNNK
jgi:flagellar hook-associated protein 2